MTNDVVFQTLGTACGKHIGIATLNVEAALNALNLEMVKALFQQLSAWQQDDKTVAVILDGSGEKAFCAGGDIRALYQAAKAADGEVAATVTEFFSHEYQLDYLMHTFDKPLLVWGDGIVMGGGLGLMVGASHRVVTEHSRLAMPEVSIGLYPDVGGSYFLNRMPGKLGLFLALTGYGLKASDCLYSGLATHYLHRDDKQLLLDKLAEVKWGMNTSLNKQKFSDVLVALRNQLGRSVAVSPLKKNQGLIDELFSGDLREIDSKLVALETEVEWLAKARNNYLAGSPLSICLGYAQSQIGTEMTLAECFRQELDWSVNCTVHGDFVEGVRALLIDKDKTPHWHVPHVSDVPEEMMTTLMTSPWHADDHPLNKL
ncbi:enoyl-CoA hydratase/isomerase family protein [Shewanella sp. NIFS-20-20]|uniref:enoyl-CoA hydratase/isomerase family protein n=1 Tax=Shewanella sp. NIFS-20-20 TaxID=2853806 RepID=UPI001C444FEC|nr:enoyl-CoA hydratase/isomerase family protein [Shewanella sp. NIFS-20-20]MBV7316809.1 enoyl-CoA hydratase/isomerase family protein [Shewanella sp. NIFS-20-20]